MNATVIKVTPACLHIPLTTFLVKVEMKNPSVDPCVNRGGGMTWHGTLSNSVVIRQAGLKALAD